MHNGRYFPPTKEFIAEKKRQNEKGAQILGIFWERQKVIIGETKNKITNIIEYGNIYDIINFGVDIKNSYILPNSFIIRQYLRLLNNNLYVDIDYSNQIATFDKIQIEKLNESENIKKLILKRINKVVEIMNFNLFEHTPKSNIVPLKIEKNRKYIFEN